MTRQLLVLCLCACLASAPARAKQAVPTEDTLKLAHQTLISALTSGNPTMLRPVLLPNGVGFFRDGQMVAQLGSGISVEEAIPSILADLGRFTVSADTVVYRVAGTAGVVCMASTLLPKKGEKGGARYVRSTWVYANMNGNWRLMSWHSSDIPLKK